MKKVLFVNPAIDECGVPNTGLAMLSAVLKLRGHTVKIADYHFSSRTPKIEAILDDFRPDIAGISLFSCTASVAGDLIDAIHRRGIPLLCGGPHATSYYEELSSDPRFDHIIVGEAEQIIIDAVERPTTQTLSRTINCPLPDVNELPFPDYRSFYDSEHIGLYPIITSRGCPFDCTFCSIRISNSRIWRPRALESCIEELKRTRYEFPFIQRVMIWDDNFSLNIQRAKRFLQMFLDEGFTYKINVANVRADKIDKEFLLLLKRTGCEEIQFGVEHGNPDVFKHIGKGETLDDIRRAARLVNECGMMLGCSFIIGLPYDTLRRTVDSVRFARTLKADHVHWNILVPYKYTKVYQYFQENGEVDDNIITCTIPHDSLSFQPNASTLDFSREERKKAYVMALLLSKDTLLLQDIKRTFLTSLRYNLTGEFLLWLLSIKILKNIGWKIKKHIFGH